MHENCKEKMFKITNQQHIYHKVDIEEVFDSNNTFMFQMFTKWTIKSYFKDFH